jgi:hypothetical protein
MVAIFSSMLQQLREEQKEVRRRGKDWLRLGRLGWFRLGMVQYPSVG